MLILLLGSAALAQSSDSDLEALWRQGYFDEARSMISARLQAGNQTLQFLREASQAAEEMRDYSTAAELFAQLAKQAADQPEAYREAREHEWCCRWAASGENLQAAWIAAAKLEIAARNSGMQGKKSAEYRLGLELQSQLEMITGQAEQPAAELRQRFPDSVLVLRAAKAAADEIGSERQDARRIELCQLLLKDYPGNYWRHVAYRYLLYTAWRTHNQRQLKQTAASYLAEYPNHPSSHGAVSRYYLDADVELQAGLTSATRSVELYETALGTDGALGSLAEVHERTQDLPLQPDYLPPNTRGLFIEYLGSRYNLARYHVHAAQWDAALKQCEPVIQLSPFSLDEDLTLAPFYLSAAQAAQGLKLHELAYRYALGALVEGDSTNRYGVQAAALLEQLAAEVDAGLRQEIRAEYIPFKSRALVLPVFSDATKAAGLDQQPCRKVAWGDVNQDGAADLLLDGKVLLLNTGSRKFTDATRSWGLSAAESAGGCFADYDNDGDLDLYSFGDGKQADRLWRNEGLRFADVTAAAGNPSDGEDSQAAVWLDYDADGWLDLYVANAASRREWSGEDSEAGAPGRLYHNSAHGTFTAVNLDTVGLTPPFGLHQDARGVLASDLDGNGLPDLLISNYRLQENTLFMSTSRGFSNMARQVGIAGESVDGGFGNTLGSCSGDFDNDGDFDLFCSNLAPSRMQYACNKSMLLVNSGASSGWTAEAAGVSFTDQRAARGIKYDEAHCNPLFADLNHDGWLDLYITSAYENRRSYLYLNDGQGRFIDVTYLSGARAYDARGSAVADYDGDGDIDLAVATTNGIRLLRNDSPPAHWLAVKLEGGAGRDAVVPTPLSNRSGIGAQVTLSLGDQLQTREIQSTSGIGCGDDAIARFGLGAFSGRIGIIVHFPSGLVVTKALMQADQQVLISEVAAIKQPAEVQPPQPEPAPAAAPAAPIERPRDGSRSN